MDRQQWNERYGQRTVWSGQPNAALVAHAPALPAPGARALDLGCGEGADALWLAAQGWAVTGVDWSDVALARARAAAAGRGVAATFVEGDITDAAWLGAQSPTGTFDLVTLAYLHPQPEDRAGLYAPLPGLVAPGGHLLVIAHDPQQEALGVPGPEPERLLSPADVVAALQLPEGFEVVIATARARTAPEGGPDAVRGSDSGDRGAIVAVDAIVVAHRGGSQR